MCIRDSHWIIDEEAAEVVRRIYRIAIEGKGPYEIARILATEKVERPSYYLAPVSYTHLDVYKRQGMFDTVNTKVGEIAGEVGQTPLCVSAQDTKPEQSKEVFGLLPPHI